MLVNGSPKGHIIPSRGLQQGDLLSLYLFLLCTEGLISLLSNSNYEYHVSGTKVCRGAPFINHPLFANDSVLFYKVDMDTNKNIQKLLKVYELTSGQHINTIKTTIIFSKNTLRTPLIHYWPFELMVSFNNMRNIMGYCQ